MRVQMEIKIEQRPLTVVGGQAAWYLYVNERLHVAGESYAMCDQVRAALEGAAWPCQEAHEIAGVIRQSLDPSKEYAKAKDGAPRYDVETSMSGVHILEDGVEILTDDDYNHEAAAKRIVVAANRGAEK